MTAQKESTVPRGFAAALWLAGSLVTIWTIARGWSEPNSLVRKDFANLWVAGKLALDGSIVAIFDVEEFRASSISLIGERIPGNYSYPPHALFLAVPFALLPYDLALIAWTLTGAAFFMWASKPYCPKSLPLWLVVLTPAALVNMRFGHYGFFIGGLWLLAFSKRGGLAAAALTIKPHLGALVAVQMIRNRSQLPIAIIGALLLMVLSALVFGLSAWVAFFTETFGYQAGLISPENKSKLLRMMVTPYVAYDWAAHACFAVAAIILVSRNFNAFTAATATFLIVPYGFHYDMTVANLGFAVLLISRWDEMPAWQRLVCSLAFLSPEIVNFGSWLVPPLLLAALYVQALQTDQCDHEQWRGGAM